MLHLLMPMVGGTRMFVAMLGDRQGTPPANWTKETAIAIEPAFDAASGAGPGASLTLWVWAVIWCCACLLEVACAKASPACWVIGRSRSLPATVPRSNSRSTACSATRGHRSAWVALKLHLLRVGHIGINALL